MTESRKNRAQHTAPHAAPPPAPTRTGRGPGRGGIEPTDVDALLTPTAEPATEPAAEPAEVRSNLIFGTVFTPSMLLARYALPAGWCPADIVPRQPLQLDPATTVLHYGQAVFEGVKAHRQPDGSLALFRARVHAERLLRSCEGLAIPAPDADTCIELWCRFARHEAGAVPEEADIALYLRPLLFGCDEVLTPRPSTTYQHVVLGALVTTWGPERRMEVLVGEEYTRPASTGLGPAKTPGNYSGGMRAFKRAVEEGCDQVLWLDPHRRRWIQELGSSNVCFVLDGVLVTPPVSDTLLAGVTRDTLLELAREDGLAVDERPIAWEEVTAALSWKGLSEAFACSTAVGVASIGAFHFNGRRLALPQATPVANRLRELIEQHERGQVPDTHDWLTPI